MSRSRPSRADQALADQICAASKIAVSANQVRRWASDQLLPWVPGGPGPGRGHTYPPEAIQQGVALAELVVTDRHNLDEAALILWVRGRDLSDERVRSAFRRIYKKLADAGERAYDQLLNDRSQFGGPARGARKFAKAEMGAAWRQRLTGTTQHGTDGKPEKRPSRPDRVRTIRPSQALRDVVTAEMALMVDEDHSSDILNLLLTALALDGKVDPDEFVENVQPLYELEEAIERAPMSAFRQAVAWITALPGIARIHAITEPQRDLGPALIGTVTNDLDLALAAPSIVAIFAPDYDLPDLMATDAARGRLALEMSDTDLRYALQIEEPSDPEIESFQQRLQALGAKYPKEVEILLSEN